MTNKSNIWHDYLDAITPPYDFDLSIQALDSSMPPAIYKDKTYLRALNLSNNKEIVIKIKSVGKLNAPILKVEVLFDRGHSTKDINEIRQTLEWMFDFKMDLKPFYDNLRISDSKLYAISQQLKGLKIMTEPNPFEVLIKCVCFQMISFSAAMKVVSILVNNFGHTSKIDSKLYIFPTPNELIDGLSREKSMLSKQKIQCLREISKIVCEHGLDLNNLRKMSNEEIIEYLCSIKGIGTWTAELFLIWGLKRYRVIPADDKAAKRILSEFYQSENMYDSQYVRRYILKKWGDYSGLMMYYLMTYTNRRNIPDFDMYGPKRQFYAIPGNITNMGTKP